MHSSESRLRHRKFKGHSLFGNHTKNSTLVSIDENFKTQNQYTSIEEFPSYIAPPKDAKVSYSYDITNELIDFSSLIGQIHGFKLDQFTNTTTIVSKMKDVITGGKNALSRAFYSLSPECKKMVISLAKEIANHQISSVLSSLGIPYLTFILLSLQFVRVDAQDSELLLKIGSIPQTEGFCKPEAGMIYCGKFYGTIDNALVVHGGTKLIADENWAKSFNHRDFSWGLTEQLECIQVEQLADVYRNNVLDASSKLTGEFANQTCAVTTVSHHQEWSWTAIRSINGLSPEECARFQNMNKDFSGCHSNWNFNTHALVAALITVGVSIVSVGLFYKLNKKFNDQADPRRILPAPSTGFSSPGSSFSSIKKKTTPPSHVKRLKPATPRTAEPDTNQYEIKVREQELSPIQEGKESFSNPSAGTTPTQQQVEVRRLVAI